MSWSYANVKAVFPSDFTNVVNEATTASQQIAGVVATLQSAIAAIQTFKKAQVDPFELLLLALSSAAQALLTDFFGTGFYILEVSPDTVAGARNNTPIQTWRPNTPYPLGSLVSSNPVSSMVFRSIAPLGVSIEATPPPTGKSGMSQPVWPTIPGLIVSDNGVSWIAIPNLDKVYDSNGIPQLTPNRAVAAAIQSLSDIADLQRPQFSNGAQVAGFAIMATAPTLPAFQAALEGLSTILTLASMRVTLRSINRALARVAPAGTVQWSPHAAYSEGTVMVPAPPNGCSYTCTTGGTSGSMLPYVPIGPGQTFRDGTVTWQCQGKRLRSIPPDWRSFRLEDIPHFATVYQTIRTWVQMGAGYALVATDSLGDTLNAIIDKVQQIISALNNFNAAMNALINALGATGVYWLDIPGATGGNSYIASTMQDMSYIDPSGKKINFSSLTQNQYTYMVLFVGGGSSYQDIVNVKKLFSH